MENFDNFRLRIQPDYPNILQQMAVSMQIDKQGAGRAQAMPAGYIARNQQNNQVVQFRSDGFSFSRLSPYERWESFRDEGKSLWELYNQLIKPQAIGRAAIRYINRLELPHNSELKDYFNIFPELRTPMPVGLEGFFVRVQLAQPEIECVALINQSTISTNKSSSVAILLDLDLFRIGNLPKPDQGLWELLEAMHSKQNELFESCITNELRKMIA